MSERHDISFTLNGKPVSATVDARLNLADFLRHTLRLTGTHVGCEHGVCGGHIGRSTPRRDAERLAGGRGRYTDDLDAANLGHVAFLRSPHAHARILSIDVEAARQSAGVIAVVTGDDLATVCKPWQTRLVP